MSHNDCTIDLSCLTCGDSPYLTCVTNALATCGCQVFPTWELFQEVLNNPAIIANLEADGNFVTVPKLSNATAAEVEAVPGIGPAAITALTIALAEFNLEFRV